MNAGREEERGVAWRGVVSGTVLQWYVQALGALE